MIWNLDTQWLLIAFSVTGILSFFFGMAMDGIMGKDGFGPIANSAIICCTFFLTIYVGNKMGISLRHLEVAAPFGLSGSLIMFAFLVFAKAALKRFLLRQ